MSETIEILDGLEKQLGKIMAGKSISQVEFAIANALAVLVAVVKSEYKKISAPPSLTKD